MNKRPLVAICSLFRNCSADIKECFKRRKKLTYPCKSLVHICIEGDSEDNTFELLQNESERMENVLVKKHDKNIPPFWGFIHPARMKGLADSANFALEMALKQTNAEYVLWLESDLEYPEDLIERLLECQKDIVATMIFIKGTNLFYDIWAFRKGDDLNQKGPEGALGCFQANPPHHPVYDPERIFQVDSAGSVLLLKREVIEQGAHFTDEEAIVGLCQTARSKGFDVWADPSITVWHPVPKHMEADGQRAQRMEPWHESKVFSKFQEKVPIDQDAYAYGQRLSYGRPLEYGWIAKRLCHHQGRSVLDFGVGDSEFSAFLASKGLNVTAIDCNDFTNSHQAHKTKYDVEYQFMKADGCNLSFPDAHFDQITAVSAIEYEKSDRQLMKELTRVCKPKGRIYFTVHYDHHAFWRDD